ncbi:LysR family transcriptional regulator [Nocardioides marmoriginsengisoli]|uniref:LysR family transcriptional regulator n=1 Tax=Nocardioides marmoriginsengisoli TaxID=661483 RepID=A0A3N0CBH2_9ACTN|nr:LysR family transcriptional regulator [Nocardioides marmoriginsengisoli]RNL60797.1 LysR family transcriptional regulator [Nocardioides marmoriginsengisoli]
MTQWPDLSAVELLVAIAEHGSVSAGAKAIGMAQPNASRSLARLERALDVSLVTRSTTGARLTPAGLMVVDWSRDVLSAASVLIHGAATLASSGGGELTVSASQTIAEHLLPAWLASLRAEHEDVAVRVEVLNTAAVLAAVLSGSCEVGFVEGPRAPSGVHSAVVARDELVLVVGAEHPWARRRGRVTSEELVDTPMLTREPGSGTRVRLDDELRRRTGRVVTAQQELASNAAVRVAVQAGAGPAVLSRLSVAEALATGAVLEVPVDLDLGRELRAVWTGPRRLTGPSADLVRIARAHRF